MAVMILENVRFKTLEVVETPYKFDKGAYVYPLSTADKYPCGITPTGKPYNYNRHKVVFYSECSTVDDVRKMLDNIKCRVI